MRHSFHTLLVGTILATGWGAAYAQTPAEDAVRIAQTIGEQNLFLSNLRQYADISIEDRPAEALRLQRHKALHAISVRDETGTPRDLQAYTDMANEHGTLRDQNFAQFLNAYIEIKPLRGRIDDPASALIALEGWSDHEDWFVAHMAVMGQVQVHADEGNISYALQLAADAYEALPLDSEPYTLEARSNTLSIMASLQSITNDWEGSVRSAKDLIQTRQQLGFPVDGETLLNNLAYVATNWGDQTTGLNILAHAMPSGEKGLYGLKEVREIRLLIEIGEYEQALDIIDQVESKITYPPFKPAMIAFRSSALAGIGNIEEAKWLLDSISNVELGSIERLKAQTELLIAAQEGRATDALLHSNEIVRRRVQPLLQAANADTANFLATLDNAKARQEERQAALERDARNKQMRARMAMAIAALLAVVAALLGMMAIYSARFARWRTQNAELIERLTIQAQSADRSKRNFLGMMSHELRTPLNGVIGLADHLRGTLHSREHAHLAAMISESGYDLLDVVENILDMAQIDTGQMVVYEEALDLRALIADVEALWRPMITSREHDRDVRFTTHVNDSVPAVVELDPIRVRQILNQLLSNAGKFTHTGRVHMHVTARPATEAEGPDGEMGPPTRPTTDIEIIVADTGMGITETARARLFEPFVQADTSTTRKFGGSGLGLAITRSLARIMHGDIDVVSNAGRGSEFRLVLKAPVLDRSREGLTSHVPSPLVTAEEALMVRRNSKPSQFWNPNAPVPSYPRSPALVVEQSEPETRKQWLARHWRTFRAVMMPGGEGPQLPPEIQAQAERQANATRLKRRRVADLAEDVRLAAADADASQAPVVQTSVARASASEPSTVIEATDRFHAAPDTTARGVASPVVRPGLRVIAAEDVVMNQRVLEALIEGPDAHVVCVGTAEALISRHASDPFDVIIMDIHMPGMGGVEGIREIRKSDPSTPIIALTADVSPQTNARALQAGADLFLTKPVIEDSLQEAFAYCAQLRRDVA